MLVVVKYVVKEILPHFRGTFKSGDWGKLGENGGVQNILGSRTGLVLRLPKQARYHLRYTRLFGFYPAGHIHPKQPRDHRCRSPAFLRPCASCSVAGSPISIMDCRGKVNLRLPLHPRVKSKIPHPPPWNAWQPSVLLFFSIISL